MATSNADELVPFTLYPASALAWLQAAFDEHDTEMAQALGVPRLEPGQDYYVGLVLSQDWWDDGAWQAHRGRDAAIRPD